MASPEAEDVTSLKEEPTDLSSSTNPSSSRETSEIVDTPSLPLEDGPQQESTRSDDCSMETSYTVSLNAVLMSKERERAKKKTIRDKTFMSLPGLLIFREFCLEMNVSMDVKKMHVNQMVANLQKFFFYVRVKPGAVLQQLFEQISIVIEAMRGINIRKDVRFKKVVRVCRGRINSFDHIRCHSPQITEQLSMFCLRKLIFSTDVRPNHPTGLFNLTLFYMVIYMCKGTTHWTELKALLVSMRKSSFVCKKDISKGVKFITIRNEPQCTAGRLYEIPGHPICPFKIFRLFMSKLSISSNYLWQRPKPHSKMSECWFHPDASNTINNDWLLDLTEKASMTVSYTNMSLVLTPRSVMDSTLSDPIFTKTYSNEVKEIPNPPKFDSSNLDSALPGGNDKLEIKLLNSSEAQVEIRLTDILWKELFPEWDRTRLVSGYQNHVDFMKHLLEVHKTCKDESCCNPETGMEESTEEVSTSDQQASQENPPTTPITIPINVAQHGFQNSSLLTVVNNNTVAPQTVQGSHNFIVPLNTLLESLASSSQAAVQVDAGSSQAAATSSVSPRLVTSLQAASSLLQSNLHPGGEKGDLSSIAQNGSNLNQISGPSSKVLLPSLVTNPCTNSILPLSAMTSAQNQPSADTTSIDLLAGNKTVVQSLVDNAQKLSQGLQSVNVQGFPLPIIGSFQNGASGISSADALQSNSLNSLNVTPISSLPSNMATPVASSQTLLTNAIPKLALPSLQNVGTTAIPNTSNLPNTISSVVGSMPALKRMIPIAEPQLIPTSGIRAVPELQSQSFSLAQTSSVLQGTSSTYATAPSLPTQPVHQIIAAASDGNTNSVFTNGINTFAEQLTASNSAASTFVITNHGIIAVPNIQQSPHTVVSQDNNNPSISTISVNPINANIPDSETLQSLNSNSFTLAPSLLTRPQDNYIDEENGYFQEQYYDMPVKALDYSTKSHTLEGQFESQEMDEEAPLDLSISKPKNDLEQVPTISTPSLALPNSLSVIDSRHLPRIKDKDPRPLLPNNALPGVAAITSVRRPPPPYPGLAQKFLAPQAIAQLGYPRFVREPTKNYPGFMKMTLKRKSTTGKSVRELLDKKRKNDLARSGQASQSGNSMLVGASSPNNVSGNKVTVGIDTVTHQNSSRLTRNGTKKAENVTEDDANERNNSETPAGNHHSLITLANLYRPEQNEVRIENGQHETKKSHRLENCLQKFDVSKTTSSKSPEKGRQGRRSRRKPQQVFKRTMVEDPDIIDEIEDFS